MTLGEKLQMLRKSRSLSQEQLAEELEVSRQAISKWECGDSVPDLDKLKSISRYFGVTTDYLIFEEQTGLQPEQAEKSLDVETCKKALLSLIRENIGRILCYAAAAYCFFHIAAMIVGIFSTALPIVGKYGWGNMLQTLAQSFRVLSVRMIFELILGVSALLLVRRLKKRKERNVPHDDL